MLQPENFIQQHFFQVQLQQDAVCLGKEGISFLLKQGKQGRQVRPVGDGSAHVVVVVKDGQPGAHAVGYLPDQAGIHAVFLEARQYVFSGAVGIHQGKEHGIKPQVAQVFRDIPADTAVDIPDFSGVPPAGNIGAGGISLDIHKDAANHNNTHVLLLFRSFIYAKNDTTREPVGFIKSFSLFYHRKLMKNNRKTA